MTTATELDRDEWLAWRRYGVGGSDIAAILGLSPWASPFSVWAEKVGLYSGPEETELMEAGRWLEHALVPWFEDRTGLYVAGQQRCYTHPEEPWMRCTADGSVFSYPGTKEPWEEHAPLALGGLEMKTAGPRLWTEIPEHYSVQCFWQMAVTGWPQVWLAALHGRRLRIYEVPRPTDAVLEALISDARDFWHEHVLTGNPPPLDGTIATLDTLTAMYPTATPGTSVPVDDVADNIAGLIHARSARRAAEALEREHKAAIMATLGEAAEGTLKGQRAVSWQQQERRNLDADRLRTEHPDIAAAYTTITSHRVLRTHDTRP